MKPSELIRKGWCKGYYARTCNMFEVSPCSNLARTWCAYGAIQRVYKSRSCKSYEMYCDMLTKEIGGYSIEYWNDFQKNSAPIIAAMERVEAKLGIV